MEAPPASLYSEEFMRDTLWRALKPGGFVAVNAIGRREQYVTYCRRWRACGFWPVYVFAIDPNIVGTAASGALNHSLTSAAAACRCSLRNSKYSALVSLNGPSLLAAT